MSKKEEVVEEAAPAKKAAKEDPLAIIDELLEKLKFHMPSHAEADTVAADVNARLGR